jgi:hypothetical protein
MQGNRVFVLLTFLFLMATGCSHTRRQKFAFDPTMGQVYHFRVDTRLTEKIRDDSYAGAQSFSFSLQCIRKSDSLRTMKMVFERFQMTSPARSSISLKSGKKIDKNVRIIISDSSVSTDGPAADPQSTTKSFSYAGMWVYLLKKTIGDSLIVVMNNRGEVLRVYGFDQIVDTITVVTGIDHPTVNAYLKEYIGSNVIKDLIGQLFFFLPVKPVKQGDNWIKDIILIAKAPVKHSNLLTVQTIKGDTIVLDLQSAVSARTGEGDRLYAQGRQKGVIIASFSTGMIYSYNLEENSVTETDHYNVGKTTRFNVTTH